MPSTSAKTFRLLNGSLGVLILAAMMLIGRDMVTLKFGRHGTPSAVKSAIKPSAHRVKQGLRAYAAILEKNPFGEPRKLVALGRDEKKRPAPSGVIANLTLTGTATGPGEGGYAIFEDRSRPDEGQKGFRMGQEVFDYGKLVEIGDSFVKIERDSTLYTLTIPFEKIATSQHDHKKSSRKKLKRRKSTFARQVGEREYVLDRRKVEQSLADPEKLLTDARMLPNIKNGKHEGFVISEIIPGGLYDSLGLKNGDILLRINGLEISNPEVAIQAMSALRGMNSVDLDIIRGGNNISLNYRIQ
jgi:general secretion pathway protein C